MSEFDEESSANSYWPSVADLFLTLFIIAIAIVAVVFAALLPTNNLGDEDVIIQAVGSDLKNVREPLNELRNALKQSAIPSGQSAAIVLGNLRKNSHEAALLILDHEERLLRLLTKDSMEESVAKRLLQENDKIKKEMLRLEALSARLTADNKELTKRNEALVSINEDQIKRNEELLRVDDKPPIIQISESEGEKEIYRFAPASSEMNDEFIKGLVEDKFRLLVAMILERQKSGLGRVNTLEIIGHTDPTQLKANNIRGNLDIKLPLYLAGKAPLSSMNPGSNNDLGLLRALAVKEQWNIFVEQHAQSDTLQEIKVRCYSAGQTIPPATNLLITDADPNAEDINRQARRIEMRLTLIDTESKKVNTKNKAK